VQKVDHAVLDRHSLNELNTAGTTKDIKIFKRAQTEFFMSYPSSCLWDVLYAVIMAINGVDFIIYIIRMSLSIFAKNSYIYV